MRLALLLAALASAAPRAAFAQESSLKNARPMGERYHVEVSSTLWNPSLFGQISADQLSLVGSSIDFGRDLGFGRSHIGDFNFVLRPGRKHRLRAEYSPVTFTSNTTFSRIVTFAGVPFPISLPIHSTLGWTTWRFGYEYDFIYRPRGFVGVLFEARNTRLHASLASDLVGSVTTDGSAVLPAIGVVGRAYVVPGVAVNFELSGLCALHKKTGQFAMQCAEDANPDYQASYFDWNIYGTMNLSNYLGAQVGWRRTTTLLNFGHTRGDLKFTGLWFGGVVRY
jgi:hypothetical protein